MVENLELGAHLTWVMRFVIFYNVVVLMVHIEGDGEKDWLCPRLSSSLPNLPPLLVKIVSLL